MFTTWRTPVSTSRRLRGVVAGFQVSINGPDLGVHRGRKAVYSLIERGRLPGITRIGRRVLVRSDALMEWLDGRCEPSDKDVTRTRR